MLGILVCARDLYFYLITGVFQCVVHEILENGEQEMIVPRDDRVVGPEIDVDIKLFVLGIFVSMLPMFP